MTTGGKRETEKEIHLVHNPSGNDGSAIDSNII